MAATVTLKRPHFETLLRRAELHSVGKDTKHVTIPEADYNNLVRIAHDFASLKESLYKGGISEDTLEILIRGEGSHYTDQDHSTQNHYIAENPVLHQQIGTETPIHEAGELGYHSDLQYNPSRPWADEPTQAVGKLRPEWSSRQASFRDDGRFTPDFDREDASITTRAERPNFARNEQRTVLLKGLPENVTHADVVKALKGGLILDIYLRANDRSASVSFVEGSCAQQFLTHIRRNDLYIGGKRINIQWNDRQFILPGHVANKIGIGATRNLVIRSTPPNITEDGIRDDLDHIHNLVVISMNSREGDTYIELNSIHNAMFARTCMMSRAKYKGLKIDWSYDACTEPLPVVLHPAKSDGRGRLAALKPIAAPNRFQMLEMEGTEDATSDEEDQTTTTLSDLTNLQLNQRSPWNCSTAIT